jgi:hypothetical protein
MLAKVHFGSTTMRSVNRIVTAAVFGLLSILAPATVNAGSSETQFLQSLVGSWAGRGQVSGEDGGTMTCRMTFKPSGERLNYNGRCTLSGGSGSQSFSGRISYNDAKGVYESTSRGRTVRGQQSGSTLVFTTSVNNTRGKGTSTMQLSPGGINVSFDMVNRRGERSAGSIPFSRG